MLPPRKPCETRKVIQKLLGKQHWTPDQLIARMAEKAQELRPVGGSPPPPTAKRIAEIIASLLDCEVVTSPEVFGQIGYLFEACLGEEAKKQIGIAIGIDVARAYRQVRRYRTGLEDSDESSS